MLMLGGCCGLLSLLFCFGVFGAYSLVTRGQKRREVAWLLQSFVLGHDRSQVRVSQIANALMTNFSHDLDYQDLAASVASYEPGGKKPFLNEAALDEVFREFLRKQYRIVLPPPDQDDSVWPPAPRRLPG